MSDNGKCTRCGAQRGQRWEHEDWSTSGEIRFTACSRIYDAIAGTVMSTTKVDSPFYVDGGFQHGKFVWGIGSDAKLCWHCNRALMTHVGKFFLEKPEAEQ